MMDVLAAVFDKKGKPLGLIRMPGVTNMGFGDNSLNKLYILNDTSIHSIELQVPINLYPLLPSERHLLWVGASILDMV